MSRNTSYLSELSPMDSNDFKSVQDKIQSALVATTRRTNQIAAEDLGFHRSSNPTAGEQLDETSERLLALSTSLLGAASKGTDLKAPDLEDADDVDVHWSRIVDVIDTLLEKADTCLDEYTGLVKRKGGPTEENAPQAKKPKTFTALDSSMRRANILKPQNAFEVKPDNSDTSPWKPLLTKKPHASVPLDESVGTFSNENGTIQHKHPYETEILKLEYPSSAYETREPIPYQPMETTSATFVNTFEGVLDMLVELKKAKEIAIDTEHHDFRTYSGLLSLMQISTRDKDWIVDTLQPWRHKLEVLNEVFADPKIIKVLHGAYMDIIWLQRDLGLYVVGLFDTFHAAEALGYSAKSLAYLLKRFIDFDADKKYQMADWRIRPIPDEMFYYARSDTHFLLYIYDMMRNELLARSNRDNPEEDYITHVLERSKEVSLRRYERFIYDAAGGQGPFGWYNMLIKSSGNLTREQFSVFRAVHKWRDDLARREDESPVFIFSNAALFDIAKRLPPDPKALHSILGFPSSHASNLARQLSADLFKVIDQAKTEGTNGPTLSDFFRSNTVGIGEVAKQVFPKLAQTPEEGVLDTKELVAGVSRLWGDVPVSSRWEHTPVANKGTSSARFALPWATFLENAAVSDTAVEKELPSRAAPAPKADIEPRGDEEFTLKSGRKRKAPEPEVQDEEEGEAAPDTQSQSGELGEEEITFVGSSDEEEAQKARKKEEKKARKELKKAQKQAAKEAQKTAQANGTEGKVGEEGEDDDEAPFDYSKAKSMLSGKRDNKGGKTFNPYSSLNADGPKAARRMHHEKTGKTATFKKI